MNSKTLSCDTLCRRIFTALHRLAFDFCFCLYTLITLIAVIMTLKETSQHHHKEKLRWSFISKTYRHLLTNRVYLRITLSVSLTYGAFFSWFTVSPVLLIHVVGLTPVTFGWLSFLTAAIA